MVFHAISVSLSAKKMMEMRHKFFRLILLAVALFGFTSVLGQGQPVRWQTKVEPLGDALFRVIFQADLASGWHMYDMGPYEGGPNATLFTLQPGEGMTLVGEIEQLDRPVKRYDELFGMEIGYFERQARFAQQVQLTVPSSVLKATVEWMVCDDQSCMPPEEADFSVTVTGGPTLDAAGTGSPKADGIQLSDGSAIGVSQGAQEANAAGERMTDANGKEVNEDGAVQSVSADAMVAGMDAVPSGGSLWGLIIEAILWGFAALLTPCVFPMVPMTVSFFLKNSGSAARGRFRASMYGFFIVALYTVPIGVIILLTRWLGGDTVTADIFNWLATHWLPNVIFFLVFMAFAASFFGAFEITMPSRLVSKSDSQSDRGGLAGVFFMALTLVLVSFSCTGPIVGSVLIKSTAGQFWEPIVTMFAFSLAFALPFTIFAFFPSLLKNLPKSGGWLNSVKVVLGFIEVALGLKFLSVADQTYHWGLLDREVYLAIWIVVFTLLGLYLLGKIRFTHDSEVKHIGVGRLFLSIVTFSFVVYLIPGLFGAPLKGLSGYLPPMHTQDFVLGQTSGSSPILGGTDGPTTMSVEAERLLTVDGRAPKYSDFLHLPHQLTGFFDLQEAEAYAERVNKPLFIDFTGHGCVNCREMEARVWSDPQVLDILRNDYVIVALYADDKKVLPEEDWVTLPNGKVLKTLGKINSHYALSTYGVNAQPYYVLQGRDGKILVPPRGYDLDVNQFVEFLLSGIAAYQAQENAR